MLQFGMPVQVEEIKSQGDGWEVTGYASTFGNVDLGGDVVMPGAFKRWIAMWESGKVKTRFLRSHHPDNVLGVPASMKEDTRGLLVRNKISRTKLGEETRQLLKDGAMDSFSIGYVTLDSHYDEKEDVRRLLDLDLPENSIVAMPMNPEALVTSVKSYLESLGFKTEIKPDDDPATLAEKAASLHEHLDTLLSDVRGLLDSLQGKDRPLSNTKRQELTDLLEMFSGLDAVRSDLQSVLTTAPQSNMVQARRLRYELDLRKQRMAHILQEQ